MYKFTENLINPDAFDQGEVWYDKTGRCHKIEEMSFTQVKNVIRYLKFKTPLNVEGSVLLNALRARQSEALHEIMNGARA